MKKIALILGLFVGSVAQAEQPTFEMHKLMQCGSPKTLFDLLRDEYRETPIWGGEKEKSRFVLTVNSTTFTWSLVEFTVDAACLVDSGTGFKTNMPANRTTL
jgi:hypothetical protein